MVRTERIYRVNESEGSFCLRHMGRDLFIFACDQALVGTFSPYQGGASGSFSKDYSELATLCHDLGKHFEHGFAVTKAKVYSPSIFFGDYSSFEAFHGKGYGCTA